MAVVTMRQLLESGVHFGHQTRRWNPKMKRFIMTERNGIYIIDLQQSLAYIDRSYAFIKETVAKGGTIMFVGTKKQAQEAIAEQATRVGMPYVNQRWLGGMLTNFQTVHQRINRLKELDEIDFEDVAGSSRTKKELLQMRRERDKLNKSLGGIREMSRTPSAVWIVDTNKEHLAVEEARKLRIPIIGDPGLQLRPRPGRLPDPGQRRRHPRRRPADPRGRRRRRRGPDRPLRRQDRRRRRGRLGAEEPLAEWERELLGGDADKAAVAGHRWRRRASRDPGRRGHRCRLRGRRAPRPAEAAEAPPRPPPRPPSRGRRGRGRRAEAPADGELGRGARSRTRRRGLEIAQDPEVPRPSSRTPHQRRGLVPPAEAAEAAGRDAETARVRPHHRSEPPGRRRPPTRTTRPPPSTERRQHMANFTAADVKKLRDMTGAGMMDAKKALDEADGDFDKAIEILRIKGAAKAAKRGAERTATAGLVAPSGGALRRAQLRDRLRRQERRLRRRRPADRRRRRRGQARRRRGPQGRRARRRRPSARSSRAWPSRSARRSSSAGSPTSTARSSPTCTSVPPTCRRPIGVLVEYDGDDDDAARGAAMQVAAMRPQYLTRDEVPADVVAKEREIAEATSREEGKPEQAIAKIIEGRLNGFFKEVVLLEQPSVHGEQEDRQGRPRRGRRRP